MTATVIVALIGAAASMLVTAITYWTTKQREREAERRAEKLGYYKAFVESMSGIIEGDATTKGHKLFAKTTNNLVLFAPQSVLCAVYAFRHHIEMSNTGKSREEHDRLLDQMLLAIRKDVGVLPNDVPRTFRVELWASGTGTNAA